MYYKYWKFEPIKPKTYVLTFRNEGFFIDKIEGRKIYGTNIDTNEKEIINRLNIEYVFETDEEYNQYINEYMRKVNKALDEAGFRNEDIELCFECIKGWYTYTFVNNEIKYYISKNFKVLLL